MAFIRRTKRRHCKLCANHVENVDYKDVETLRLYISGIGKILPRRVTGACTTHQRRIANAIKRARIVALLPFIKD